MSSATNTPLRKLSIPNRMSTYRTLIREACAEFVGVAILTLIGIGVNCQTSLSRNAQIADSPRGEWTTIAFGWASGAALAVWVSGGISGGHINPAVTLTFATFRGFPWKKVPIYILSQLLGGIVGGAIVYANYFRAISIVEGGRDIRTSATSGLFNAQPLDYMTNVSAFFSEFLGTAILMIAILAMCDKQNSGPTNGLGPLIIFIAFLAISIALGMETGFGINPARDLGPRLLTGMVGYGRAVFDFRRQYWLWCEWFAPILGALASALVYDGLLYNGEDSVFSKKSRSNNICPQPQTPDDIKGSDESV